MWIICVFFFLQFFHFFYHLFSYFLINRRLFTTTMTTHVTLPISINDEQLNDILKNNLWKNHVMTTQSLLFWREQFIPNFCCYFDKDCFFLANSHKRLEIRLTSCLAIPISETATKAKKNDFRWKWNYEYFFASVVTLTNETFNARLNYTVIWRCSKSKLNSTKFHDSLIFNTNYCWEKSVFEYKIVFLFFLEKQSDSSWE